MGGRSIFRSGRGDPNLNVIIETLTAEGRNFTVAQRYIPEIRDGDKRILVIDGEPVPYVLARMPQGDDFRGNLARGGKGMGRPLSERDRWIAAQVGPELRERGMRFVGLDVIGDYLTEVNVTSPTCIRELDHQFGLNIAGLLFDAIEVNSCVTTPSAAVGSGDRLGVTLLFSLVAHGVLALGLTFEYEKPAPSLPSLDVILVQSASGTKPDKADFLAQAHNSGGGDSDKPVRPTDPLSSPIHKADPGLAPRTIEAGAPKAHAPTPHEVLTRQQSQFAVHTEKEIPEQPELPATGPRAN